MHPINDKFFGPNGILVSYHNGTTTVPGFILKQTGTSRFNVTDGTAALTSAGTGVTLSTSVVAATPTVPGKCVMLINTTEHVNKLYDSTCVTFEGYKYVWNVATSVNGSKVISAFPTAVSGVTALPSSGTIAVGSSIVFTVALSSAQFVTGTPTLSLNSGGKATYTSGSGSSNLVFTYTVSASDTALATIAITGINLPTGTTITNSAGYVLNLSGIVSSFSGLGVA